MLASKPVSSAQVVATVGRLRNEHVPRVMVAEARRQLQRVTHGDGRPYEQIVNGVPGAPLESVRLGGAIIFRFPGLAEPIDWIYGQLVMRSPIGPERGLPHYFEEHWVFVDGVRLAVPEGGPAVPVSARSGVEFVNARPYARRLEEGWSVQAPSGVYEVVALEAGDKFPWLDITFTYVGESDIPAPIPWPTKSWYRFPSLTVRAR